MALGILTSDGMKLEGQNVGGLFDSKEAAYAALTSQIRRRPWLKMVGNVALESLEGGYYAYVRFEKEEDMSKMQEPYVVNVKHDTYVAAISTSGPAKGTLGWRAQKGYHAANATGFRATGHRVLLSPDIVEEISAGGIVLPKKAVNAEKQTAVMATVIEIGLDCWRDKDADFCEVGDRVLIGQYTGKFHQSPKDGKEYRFVTDLDIISPIEA